MQIPLPGKWQTEPTVGELQNISLILSWKNCTASLQTKPSGPDWPCYTRWVMLEAKAQPTVDTGGNASCALVAGVTPHVAASLQPRRLLMHSWWCALSAVEGLCCRLESQLIKWQLDAANCSRCRSRPAGGRLDLVWRTCRPRCQPRRSRDSKCVLDTFMNSHARAWKMWLTQRIQRLRTTQGTSIFKSCHLEKLYFIALFSVTVNGLV